jgi:hypothetical protein
MHTLQTARIQAHARSARVPRVQGPDELKCSCCFEACKPLPSCSRLITACAHAVQSRCRVHDRTRCGHALVRLWPRSGGACAGGGRQSNALRKQLAPERAHLHQLQSNAAQCSSGEDHKTIEERDLCSLFSCSDGAMCRDAWVAARRGSGWNSRQAS